MNSSNNLLREIRFDWCTGAGRRRAGAVVMRCLPAVLVLLAAPAALPATKFQLKERSSDINAGRDIGRQFSDYFTKLTETSKYSLQ